MQAYSFQDVNCSFIGPGANLILGAGNGNAKEGIKIVRAGDKNAMLIGADGEGMNSLLADKSGTVTINLLKNSALNAALMNVYNAQQLSSQLWGQNIITVGMAGVGDIHTARQVAFKKVPDWTYAAEGDMLEWVFDAVKIDTIAGTWN